jgi:predicted pyridoxine 5'-phosphate oxidase superfamily flavin-nucleotide-binding protein
MSRFAQIAYTDSVRAVQRVEGSASVADRLLARAAGPDPLGADEARFLQERDGFLIATVNQDGWPYIQHRGGPPGFVHVLDEHTVAFADVRGNRQYITVGNLRDDDRVALLFLDHAHRMRLKVLGHARTQSLTESPALTERLCGTGTEGRVERLVLVRVEGFNWNCPQHITPRFSEAELAQALRPLRDRLSRLEEENAALRATLAKERQRHE